MIRYRYFYYRNADKSIKATVCLAIDTETKEYAVGLALHNDPKVPACKKVGRNIARGRADAALFHQENKLPIRKKYRVIAGSRTVIATGSFTAPAFYEYKSNYMPTLTPYEQKLYLAVCDLMAK